MIRIGTCGWSYVHWFQKFYPNDMPRKKAFKFFQSKLDTVELNVSFYRLIPKETYESWHRQAHPHFLFSVKASRYITHIRRLRDHEESLENFLAPLRSLKDNLGPILFQLPSNFKKDLPVLELFANGLPDNQRYAFEFRHSSWLSDDVFQILKDRNIAFVITHGRGFPYKEVITADFVYIRLHGPGAHYASNYDDGDLGKWVSKISSWSSRGIDLFIYFNNDFNAYAPKNALRLKEMISKSHKEAA